MLVAVMVVALVAAAFPAVVGAAGGDTGSVKFSLKAGEYTITKGEDGFDVIEMEGFSVAALPGAPALPHNVYDIVVPPDVLCSSLELNIISAETRILDGTYDIAPIPPPLPGNGDTAAGDLPNHRNASIYEVDANFPESPVAPLPYSQMRKWKFAKVDFYPLQYNPVSKKLTLTESVVIEISYSQSPTEIDEALMADTVMDDVAARTFVNYGQARFWYEKQVPPEPQQTYDYVIITTNAIEAGSGTLSSFETHKQNLGHSVLVVTYEDDIQALTGQAPNHRAEKIRKWLQNNYASMGIEYVLLIGDPHPYESGEGDIPMKMCHPEMNQDDDRLGETPTDYFYADLTGNWDKDGDQYYGEWIHDYPATGGVDFTAEVYVGRIPVYSADYTSLDNIFQKIIDYETEPEDAIDWRQSILMPIGFQDVGYDGAVLGEQAKDDYLDAAGFSSWRMYQQGNGACSLNSIYTSEEELRGGTVVRDRWAGTDYGIVFWWAHGSTTSASVGYSGCWDGTLMNSSYTSLLDDEHPAFTYQCSCTNAHPETSNNLTYEILRNGGIATVSATRLSWFTKVPYGDFDGNPANAGIGYEYVDRLVQGLPGGDALYQAKQSMSPNAYPHWVANWYGFNLYGDPETSLESSGVPAVPDIRVQPPSFDMTLPPNVEWNGNMRIRNDGDAALDYNIADTETTGGPWFEWVVQEPDPVPGGELWLLKAKVHDPDGPGDIDYVRFWAIVEGIPMYLNDNGTDGDEVAGDGIYSGTFYGATVFGAETGLMLEAKDTAGNTGSATFTYHVLIAAGGAADGMGFTGSLPEEATPSGVVPSKQVGGGGDGVSTEQTRETVPVAPSYDPQAPSQVAVFMDSNPWGYTAIQDILTAQGISYDVYNSGQMGSVDLSPYDKVITASVQSNTFWDALEANKAWFESYVSAGGVLEMHLAAYYGSNSPGKVYPGGFVFYEIIGSNDVSIVDPAHPVLNTPNTVTDADLDGWNWSVHGWFTAIPAGGSVVLTETGSGEPVWAEGGLGLGTIFATTQTVEWRAGHGYAEFLENMILYTPAPDCPWLDESPKVGSVAPGSYDNVTVTIDTTSLPPGEYTAEIWIASNDPNENPTIVPVRLTVKAPMEGRVLFEESHESEAFTIEGSLSEWAELLEIWGFTVESITEGPITYDLLSNYCVVVIPAPTVDYSDAEVAAIKQYVHDGGGLLVIGDNGVYMQLHDVYPVVQELTAPFGMSFNLDTVYDASHHEVFSFWPLIPDFDASVVGGDVDDAVYYAGCSVNADPEGAAFPIARAYDTAYTVPTAAGAVPEGGDPAVEPLIRKASPSPEAGEGEGTSSTGVGVGEETGVVRAEVPGPLALAVIQSQADIEGSVNKALDELGYTYDFYQTDDFSTIDFSLYDVVIVGADGGYIDEDPDVLALSDFVAGGGKLIFLGGSYWQSFVDGVDAYLLDVDTVNYPWTTVGATPHMQIVDPAHPLATGLSDYTFNNINATYYMLRIQDTAIAGVAKNGDGEWSLIQRGRLIWFINTPAEFYYTDPGDYGVLKQVIKNALEAPVEGPPVMAASLHGSGRAMVTGDADMFCNHDPDGDGRISLYEYDNARLAVNIIDWLCQPIVKKPDLVITEKWEEPVGPCTYQVSYTVTNVGTATAKAGHSTTLTVDKVVIEHKVVDVALSPEQSYTDTFKTVVACTPPSDQIEVCADNYNQVAELNEMNNCQRNELACPKPSIDVEKKVWDRVEGKWVEEVTAKIDEIVRFQCTIHNDGCCDLTEILITDILSESLEYADNATPREPDDIVGNTFYWYFDGPLPPSNTITIEFDAKVVSCGVDVNRQMADAVCEATGAKVHDEDTATVVVVCGGECGDVNCSGGEPDMADVLLLWYYVGYPGQYTLCSEWAGDVNCTGEIDMADVLLLWYYVGYPGQYKLNCCPL
jgi:uncharacterized repeat protein (TIGR01451 family)